MQEGVVVALAAELTPFALTMRALGVKPMPEVSKFIFALMVMSWDYPQEGDK